MSYRRVRSPILSPVVSPLDVFKHRDLARRPVAAAAAAVRLRAMESLEPRRLFAAGDLDPSFGEGGYVINHDDDLQSGEIRDVAVQADGKTVALVYSYGLGETFFVKRYNRDGTLDTSFSGDGRTTFTFNADPFLPVALELSGSKIVIGGSLRDNFGVARLNADGSLDSSFDGDGTRVVAAPNAAPMAFGGLAVLSNGKIVLAGAAQKQFAAFRLNANGSNDTSFHGDGYRQVDMSGSAEMANAVVVQGDGKIVLGGYATGATTNVLGFAVARLDTTGGLDSTFSGDGRKFTAFPNGAARINDIVLQSDGKIVAVGLADGKNPQSGARVSGLGIVRYHANGSQDGGFGDAGFVAPTIDGREGTRAIMQGSKIVATTAGTDVLRFDSQGQIDESFGVDGTSTVPFYGFFWGWGLAAAPDGDLIVSGRISAPDVALPGMARLNADGSRDGSFGINGQVSPGGNVIFPEGEFQDVLVQSDGKIIAVVPAGTLESNTQDILIIRYNSDGTIDSTFGEDGRAIIDLGGDETGASLAFQGGKVIVGVYSQSGANLVRLNANGSLDNSFSGDGKQAVAALTGGATLVVAPDQKIVLAGRSNGLSQPTVTTFVRYNADGTLDTSFGASGNGQVSFTDELVADFGVQQDGRIVALLHGSDVFGNNPRRLIRIAASGGGIDNTFKSNEAQLNFNEYTASPSLARLAVTPDDRIVVAVTRDARGDDDLRDIWVFKFNADGSKDTSFASGGGPVFQAPDENLWVTDVVVQADGKVVIATGRSPKSAPGPLLGVMKWALHRADAAGNHDATFGDNGTILTGDGLYRGGHNPQLALAPDGDIVVATYMPDPYYLRRRTALARYLADTTTPPGAVVRDRVLQFAGTSADEQVSLWDDGAGGVTVWIDGATQTFARSAFDRIELSGGGGNDLLKLNPGLIIPALLNGGDGDDRLIGGAANDSLLGGAGNDHMTGNGGNDMLDGQAGSDVMLGSAGKDTADYSSRTGSIVVGLDRWQDDGEGGENDLAYLDIERVLGGAGNDRIGGGDANNELYGNGGNDTIGGGGGQDALFGAAGNDKLDGGDANDYLEGGAGHDTLYGGPGNDTLFGLAGNDRMLSDGDGSKDTVRGGDGTDSGDADDLDDVLSVEIAI